MSIEKKKKKIITNTNVITKTKQKFYHQGKMIDILPNLLSNSNSRKEYNKNGELTVCIKDNMETNKNSITIFNWYVFPHIKKN